MGPATVGFPQPLWSWIKSYLHMLQMMDGYIESEMEFRSIFVLFRNNRGARPEVISSSGVNRALNSLWKTVHLKGRVSATKLRKAIVTCVRRGEPLARNALAKHMAHQPTTADRYYHLQRQRDLALPISRLITHTMTRPNVRELPALEEPPTRFPRHPDKARQAMRIQLRTSSLQPTATKGPPSSL